MAQDSKARLPVPELQEQGAQVGRPGPRIQSMTFEAEIQKLARGETTAFLPPGA